MVVFPDRPIPTMPSFIFYSVSYEENTAWLQKYLVGCARFFHNTCWQKGLVGFASFTHPTRVASPYPFTRQRHENTVDNDYSKYMIQPYIFYTNDEL